MNRPKYCPIELLDNPPAFAQCLICEENNIPDECKKRMKREEPMPDKWAKAREYANFMHKKVEEFYGRKCSPADIFYKKSDIVSAFVTGWEEAIEIVKNMPVEKLEKFLKGE